MFDKFKKENYNNFNNNSWFLPALTLLFIALKLTGYITWSWWWVLAPLWIPVLLVFTVALIVAFVLALKN
jgi:fatty acid desaturase